MHPIKWTGIKHSSSSKHDMYGAGIIAQSKSQIPVTKEKISEYIQIYPLHNYLYKDCDSSGFAMILWLL